MLPSLTKLYHVTSEWSDSELSLLLSALKRDRSFSTRELAEFIQTKNKTEGVFLALAAAIQLNSRLCSRRGCGITEKFDEHCIAPLFLLSKVKHPNTLKQTREMVEYLINRFVKLWSLPKFPCSQNGSFASEGELNIQSTDIPDALFKRLSIFSLNPFSFPMEVMSPFQKILDDFRHMCSSRFSYLNRFKSMLYISLPIGLQHSVKRSSPSQPIKVVNQWKKRRIEKSSTKSRPTIRRRKALESSVPLDNLITLSFDENTNRVDSNACSDEKTDLKVNLTSRRFVNWCPGTHFIRVSDPAEDEAVKILMNKHIQVKTKKHEKIDTRKM
ncbi:hypothetical protein Smp_164820 [Schistosoma mansoni]|uniref:hypothetical protein n=1 Tax=Schistosoma mansoni TaxID=6183 RepID=UPI00022DC501|nr:hypothetical protein Smp_164820 [Schistosoma mansoni]|eukprot:XP_018653815.1 hypothetical protein Smp_164820 [Schistosoma mansoni]